MKIITFENSHKLRNFSCEFSKIHRELNIDLLQFNIIVGKNNTGKTTFLESLFYSCKKLHNEISENIIFDQNYKSRFDILTRDNDNPKISIIKDKSPVYESSVLLKEETEEEIKEHFSNIIFVHAELEFLSLESEEKLSIPNEENLFFYNRKLRKSLFLLKNNKKDDYNILVNFFKNHLKIDLKVKETKENRIEILYKENNSNNWFEINNIGTGIKKLLLCILAYLYRPALLLLDEPENHLHPNLLKLFLDFIYKQATSQVVISTHSAILINYLVQKYNIQTKFINFIKMKDENKIVAEDITAQEIFERGYLINIYNELGLELSDFFMHDKLIFVEGKDDIPFFTSIFNELDGNWHSYNIGIFELGGISAVKKQCTSEKLKLFSDNPLFYNIDYCGIIDRDFKTDRTKKKLKYKQKSGRIFEVFLLYRHSIECYVADLDYLEFLSIRNNNRKVLLQIDEKNKKKDIYNILAEKLIYKTVFRLVLSKLKLKDLVFDSDNINNIADTFIELLYGETAGDFLRNGDNQFEMHSHINEDYFKNELISYFSSVMLDIIEKRFKEENYDKMSKDIDNIISKIMKKPFNVVIYSRGHDLLDILLAEVLNTHKPTNLFNDYGSYLLTLKNNNKVRKEFNNLIKSIKVYFYNRG